MARLEQAAPRANPDERRWDWDHDGVWDSVTTTTYDAAGNPLTNEAWTQLLTRLETFTYDALGRTTRWEERVTHHADAVLRTHERTDTVYAGSCP